jgi:hypothetical protein
MRAYCGGGSPHSLPERLHLLKSNAAIFVAAYCFENALVSRLKLLQ